MKMDEKDWRMLKEWLRQVQTLMEQDRLAHAAFKVCEIQNYVNRMLTEEVKKKQQQEMKAYYKK